MMFKCILLLGSSLWFQRAQDHRNRSSESKVKIILVMLFLPVLKGADNPPGFEISGQISGPPTDCMPLRSFLVLSRFSRGADNPAQIWNIQPDNPPQVFPQRLEILGGINTPLLPESSASLLARFAPHCWPYLSLLSPSPSNESCIYLREKREEI